MSTVTIKCEVCQAMLDEEDLFCPNCGTEAPGEHQAATASVREATHAFVCQGCGASMSYDASAQALRCPFCGSAQLESQSDHKVVAAQWIVPFRVELDAARRALHDWLGKGFWRPGDLSERSSIEKMQPVYVPYWVFQAKTHTYWTADTSETPAGARGDWYPLSGEHRGSPTVLIGGSRTLSGAETEALCPFDLSQTLSPDQVDLTNVTDEHFSVPKKYARPQAIGAIEQFESLSCDTAYIPGRARNIHVNVRVEGLTSQPVLLPVWVMAYRYQDVVYRFLLNGQTGQATGQAPTSWLKIAAAVGIVLLVVVVIALVAGG